MALHPSLRASVSISEHEAVYLFTKIIIGYFAVFSPVDCTITSLSLKWSTHITFELSKNRLAIFSKLSCSPPGLFLKSIISESNGEQFNASLNLTQDLVENVFKSIYLIFFPIFYKVL